MLSLTRTGLLDIPILYLSPHVTRRKADYYRLLRAVRDRKRSSRCAIICDFPMSDRVVAAPHRGIWASQETRNFVDQRTSNLSPDGAFPDRQSPPTKFIKLQECTSVSLNVGGKLVLPE